MQTRLFDIFNRLDQAFGPQHWWPADSPFEVIVGAILTQNTNWSNVEKAIANLRAAHAIDIVSIDRMPPEELERLIRPSGFFRQKAQRLKHFTRFLSSDFAGSLGGLFALPDEQLRNLLLLQPGIGPETADSIILYAAGKASFVVDAYTQRILQRVGIEAENSSYEQTRNLFMENLPADVELFNQYHALIVRLAKECCRKRKPLCDRCPLLAVCHEGQTATKD
jgi:endonuclease-3 related protein